VYVRACRYGWELDWPVLQAALNSLEQERRLPNFGNAGSVNNLLSTAAVRMEARTAQLTTAERAAATPVPEDFMSDADAEAAAARAAGKAGAASETVFADLIGCKSVLAKLKEWQATITASQALGKDPLDSFELNFTFVGAPGGTMLVEVLPCSSCTYTAVVARLRGQKAQQTAAAHSTILLSRLRAAAPIQCAL
jgi:hypothetical protein